MFRRKLRRSMAKTYLPIFSLCLVVCILSSYRTAKDNSVIDESFNAREKFVENRIHVTDEYKRSETTVKQETNDVNNQLSSTNALEFIKLELGEHWESRQNFDCPQTNVLDLNFPICVYTLAEDKFISGAFHAKEYWESSFVGFAIRFFRQHSHIYNKSIAFIDIGANIGAYSLPLAHLGFTVLAVEPNRASLTKLAVSSIKGKVTENIRLMRFGVSNTRQTIGMKADRENRGQTILSNCVHEASSSLNGLTENTDNLLCLNDSVKTIILDDLTYLVPHRRALLKLDIECEEVQALDPSTSYQFFSVNRIPMILLEWKCHKPGSNQSIYYRNSVLAGFMSFFHMMDYAPHFFTTGKRMSIGDWKLYSEDLLVLIKNGLNETELWPG